MGKKFRSIFQKKKRYKFLYKSLIKLRENIQNKKKVLKFKKKKWEKFLIYAKRKMKFYNRYKYLDQNIYLVSKDPINPLSYEKRFRNTLHTVKRLTSFYGGILKKKIKKIITSKKLKNINSKFLEQFEKRIDVVLFRAKFATSVRNSRQLISHKKVYVNNKKVTNKSYILKEGDLVHINPKFYKLIQNNIVTNIINRNLWPLPPKYLIINYKTMEILFGDIKTSVNITSSNFNFNLNIEKIIQNYKYH